MDGRVTDQLSTKVAVLEERMNTRQAEYKTDIARLAEDAAKRHTQMVLFTAGLFIGVTSVAVAVLAAILG